MCVSFKASAPGSLMLLGEHAVLYRKHALVCAINKRMTVTLTPRSDNKIMIDSALGHYEAEIARLKVITPFQFVLAALKQYQKKMTVGCDIHITTDFSDKVGFASSAAVTVATLKALSTWLNMPLSSLELIHAGRKIVRAVQGLGSGADVAACVLGGLVVYRTQPEEIRKLPVESFFPLTVVYSGSKAPTIEVVRHVEKLFEDQPVILRLLCQAIDGCVLAGVQAITDNDLHALGKIMNVQQGLMDALGVNTPILADMIDRLRRSPAIEGAKISGSGLGDCVVGVGHLPENIGQIPVQITQEGIVCEEI